MLTARLFPLAALLLSGCATVGPDYAGPPDPTPLASSGAPFVNAGPEPSAPAIAEWWHEFGDPALDRLMDEALAANRTVRAAEARLAQSQALVRARHAERGPSASAEARYARTRPAIAAFGVEVPGFEPQDIDLFDVGLRASWELDLAGGKRRALQSALADAEAASAALGDVRLSVLNETAQAYVALRQAQMLQALAETDLAAADRLVVLVAEQRRLGVASDFDTRRSMAERARVAAVLPALEADTEAALARLAVLTGQERGALDSELLERGAIPVIARMSFPADPARVIRQRPDIRAAERRLASATAEIGVATADLFPRITLLGNLGFQANAPDAFGSDSFAYSIGPLLSWSLPDLGRVRARIAEREGLRDERLADYEQTVLAALADVETALARHREARREAAARSEIVALTGNAARLARTRYEFGAATLIDVLDAERIAIAARRDLVGSEARLAQTQAVLSTALGLGWRAPETTLSGSP